ncbi:unnamed protein product [Mycena citricolor]|uniref:Uncharacterized protein n=1 Tax=Mycena citricolor TaxID=2018698 RepID=A0AAD2HMI4_9AGAR|nr:unnamed protein product [Mycena citricolor]
MSHDQVQTTAPVAVASSTPVAPLSHSTLRPTFPPVAPADPHRFDAGYINTIRLVLPDEMLQVPLTRLVDESLLRCGFSLTEIRAAWVAGPLPACLRSEAGTPALARDLGLKRKAEEVDGLDSSKRSKNGYNVPQRPNSSGQTNADSLGNTSVVTLNTIQSTPSASISPTNQIIPRPSKSPRKSPRKSKSGVPAVAPPVAAGAVVAMMPFPSRPNYRNPLASNTASAVPASSTLVAVGQQISPATTPPAASTSASASATPALQSSNSATISTGTARPLPELQFGAPTPEQLMMFGAAAWNLEQVVDYDDDDAAYLLPLPQAGPNSEFCCLGYSV